MARALALFALLTAVGCSQPGVEIKNNTPQEGPDTGNVVHTDSGPIDATDTPDDMGVPDISVPPESDMGAGACGNGTLDPDEVCDGDCPQTCVGPDACAVGTLSGSAETCDATCSFETITACVDGDGCCAAGCTALDDDDCNAVCGNGVIEGAELCDGDCPASCTAPSDCTTSELTGDPATCSSSCVQTTITACVDGDGCCPNACNMLNDDDCSAVCGNGVIEGGEVCDGNCPAACTPPNSCTLSTLVGDPATCSSSCAQTTITACVDGDGCCAAGCTTANDDDCNAVCGNGIVEGGEACDGNCPTTCTAPNACTLATLTGDAATCTASCVQTAITACVDADGCCPASCNALNDDDCNPMCGNGVTEGAELCDGNCPTSCTAPNACTTSTLSGSSATCDASCTDTAITACVGGDGCCPAACTNANDADCPPTTSCTPGDFANLLDTYPVSNSSHTGRIFATPLGNGDALVAFHSGGTIHVVEVNADGSRTGVAHTTSGTALYGLAAHAGGRAVLVSRGSDELALVAWNPNGTPQFDETILGNVPHDVIGNEWFGPLLRDGRITWTGSSWATYNTVQRLWPDNIAHYGDTLRYYDTAGTQLSGGWGWGCSHSMQVRISHNGTRTGPVCLSDCYPSKGVHFSHNQEKLWSDPAANCAGGYSTELGASVPTTNGFWVLFAANDQRQSQDIGAGLVDNAGNLVGSIVWYTTDNVADAEPNAANYGSELLVAWTAGGTDTYVRANPTTGAVIGAPTTLAGADLDTASDFFTFPNGDVGWAFSAGGSVSLAVVEACP